MNEELTNEVLEAMTKCKAAKCSACLASADVCKSTTLTIKKLAIALLEERAKPKVWDEAPKEAVEAFVTWYEKGGVVGVNGRYTRELPKTRARIMAEEVTALVNRAIEGISVEEIESVLNKYAEELEGNE